MTARTPASTTTRKPRQSRASRGTAAAADQARPQLAAVPNLPSETPKPQPKAEPKPKPPVLGKSGYRAKYGVTDEQILKAIRDHFAANPGQGSVADWDDAKILDSIGWALNLKGALKKLRPLLSASTGTE